MMKESTRPLIKTERLILRPFILSDAKDIPDYTGGFTVADTTLDVSYPYKHGMAEQWVSLHRKKHHDDELINYAITLNSDDTIIGSIGLIIIDQRSNIAELGYCVAKDFWNKGICTEAAIALVDYAFKHYCLNKIVAMHILGNPKSGRVMQKIGMRLDSTFKRHVTTLNVWEDVNCFSILQKEWGVIKPIV